MGGLPIPTSYRDPLKEPLPPRGRVPFYALRMAYHPLHYTYWRAQCQRGSLLTPPHLPPPTYPRRLPTTYLPYYGAAYPRLYRHARAYLPPPAWLRRRTHPKTWPPEQNRDGGFMVNKRGQS